MPTLERQQSWFLLDCISLNSRCSRYYEWLACGESAAEVQGAHEIARTCRTGGISTVDEARGKRSKAPWTCLDEL
jgi:hypothetical protein